MTLPLNKVEEVNYGKKVRTVDEATPLRGTALVVPSNLIRESTAAETKKTIKLAVCVCASTFAAAANTVLFKKVLNAYKSDDPRYPHSYEFFVNQFNVLLYVGLASLVVLQRRLKYGAHWWSKQSAPVSVLCFMGFLDSAGAILSTMGGAYVAGAIQNLLNQVIIPMTLALSWMFLGQTYTGGQTMGALIIFVGAMVAVVPSWGVGKAPPSPDAGPAVTTWAGVVLFFASIVPGAMSNVYKEWGFERFQLDLFYLTTFVSLIQVLFGFTFMPLLGLRAFGGVPLKDVPLQLYQGFRCFLNENSQPGDDCHAGLSSMLLYVFVNFGFNVLQLLITKHGGATLLVISAALALPVTNFAFKLHFIMGEDTEPFSMSDVVALALVVSGFLIYSLTDDLLHRRRERGARLLPIQCAAGSMIFLRERANSDPGTPGYTPVRVEPIKRRGSLEAQLGVGRTASPAIPIRSRTLEQYVITRPGTVTKARAQSDPDVDQEITVSI